MGSILGFPSFGKLPHWLRFRVRRIGVEGLASKGAVLHLDLPKVNLVETC